MKPEKWQLIDTGKHYLIQCLNAGAGPALKEAQRVEVTRLWPDVIVGQAVQEDTKNMIVLSGECLDSHAMCVQHLNSFWTDR